MKTLFSYLVLIGLFLISYRLVNRHKAYTHSMSLMDYKSPTVFYNGK